MKFSCEKTLLQDAIALASKASSTKSSIALLEGLYIHADHGLEISGYDLSIGIRAFCDADVTETGEIVLNAKIFGDIVRKLPEDTVWIETDEKLITTIRGGKSVFQIIGNEAVDFPKLPEVSLDTVIALPQSVLKSIISQTIYAVSDNESKPIHTGCLFETEAGKLTVVAVDGYRLSVRREELACDGSLKFVVPGAALREIERILGDGEDLVRIYPDEKHIMFQIGETVLISRLLEGEFLNYKTAIPASYDHECMVDVRAFTQAVERVSLIVSERLKNPIRIRFEGNVMQMSCITAIGKSYDECLLEGDVNDLEIGFNNRYLLDALRACPDGKVKVSLKGSLNPIVFTPEEGDCFTYLVLPVRLKGNE